MSRERCARRTQRDELSHSSRDVRGVREQDSLSRSLLRLWMHCMQHFRYCTRLSHARKQKQKRDIRRIGDTLFRTCIDDHCLIFLVDHRLVIIPQITSTLVKKKNRVTHWYKGMLDVHDTGDNNNNVW